MELKGSQVDAAQELYRHLSVTAGPGAGKTTVLVERYLHILQTRDVSVDQIVAITFTNRAANEMRERLRHELDRLLREAAGEDRRRWTHHKRTLDFSVITTIHGFCARLLREFPIEAAIDPQFALLSAHQSAMLEETVVEEVLTGFINAGHELVTRLTAGLSRARLVDGLIAIYRGLRSQGLAIADVASSSAASHSSIQEYKKTIEDLNHYINQFIMLRTLPPGAERKRIQVAQRWPRLMKLLTHQPDYSSLGELCSEIEDFRELRPTKSVVPAGLLQKLDELIWERLGSLVAQICFDLHAMQYCRELIQVLIRIEQRLDAEKQRRAVLDFDDLQLRTLDLLKRNPEISKRASRRYRFFLVDEFQDTNGLQRDLLVTLALDSGGVHGRSANLFIVGDRKQSIYGFRGADVDVFSEMTSALKEKDGREIPLNLNFRSQPPLIDFFNLLFNRLFKPEAGMSAAELGELGYVTHEPSTAERLFEDSPPLVELLIDLRPSDGQREPVDSPRERDAAQLAKRILSLVEPDEGGTAEGGNEEGEAGARRFDYCDIALLFRAMTEVAVYESALRRAGIPYLTVQGKGFYQREEITDLIQLLRFLDNNTDELALAAVLRSPLCGVSDNVLLALRCGPLVEGVEEPSSLKQRRGIRNLLAALQNHFSVDFVSADEQAGLERALEWLSSLLNRRNRVGIAQLLREAVTESEFMTVVAAAFDGAQRLANVEKLFVLADTFERSGANLIRDFVRFVREFEAAGSRESEGQLDESANAVRLMTIHQSKGLQFPVVIIPELHRQADVENEWYVLDRHRGLSLKVPDGRGWLATGKTMVWFRKRASLRDRFESMRLLYVAATRTRDRLILSGAAKDLSGKRENWLAWICDALGVNAKTESGIVYPDDKTQVLVEFNIIDSPSLAVSRHDALHPEDLHDWSAIEADGLRLLRPVEAARRSIHRCSVTQLVNYQRCPRQYYFDRVLHAPTDDEVAFWNSAEAPEPPANLRATLKGAVIHRFCERFSDTDNLEDCLRSSLDDVLRHREAELAERLSEIDPEKALRELEPLARNYLSSRVRQRIERAAQAADGEAGSFSERRFQLRRPLGIVTGTIDKLLVSAGVDGEGPTVEIIDFKTNRFSSRARRPRSPKREEFHQQAFDFLSEPADADLWLRSEVEALGATYEIQMQTYALAIRQIMPEARRVKVTLHFLDPDIEISLPDRLLEPEVCARAVDEAMLGATSAVLPESAPINPAGHCRLCSFLEVCQGGRRWLAERQSSS